MGFETTPLEYGYMASLVYQDEQWYENETITKYLGLDEENGWELVEVGKGRNKTPLRKGDGGYRGMVFVHHERREIVVAHRGTELTNLGALMADYEAVAKGQLHPQVTEALHNSLDKGVMALLNPSNPTEKPYHLTFTGHSLGGFLATVCLYLTQRKGEAFKAFHVPLASAAVFDPAGSDVFLHKYEPHGTRGTGLGDKEIKDLDVSHFVSLPNYVNAYHPHAGGTLYMVMPEAVKDDNPISYLASTHKLENILAAFDEKTGHPKQGQRWEMEDWPLLDFEAFKQATSGKWGALRGAAQVAVDGLASLHEHLSGTQHDRVPFIKQLAGGEEYHRSVLEAVKPLQDANIKSALSSRYVRGAVYGEQLRLVHFGSDVALFLKSYQKLRKIPEVTRLFAEHYGLEPSQVTLLAAYQIDDQGYVTLPDSEETVFALRSRVAATMMQKQLTPGCPEVFFAQNYDASLKEHSELKEDFEKLREAFGLASQHQARPRLDVENDVEKNAKIRGKVSAAFMPLDNVPVSEASKLWEDRDKSREWAQEREIKISNRGHEGAEVGEMDASVFRASFFAPKQDDQRQSAQPSGGDDSPKFSP